MKGNKEEESETSLNNQSIKLAHRRKNIYKFGNGTSLQMRTNIFKKCKKKYNNESFIRKEIFYQFSLKKSVYRIHY